MFPTCCKYSKYVVILAPPCIRNALLIPETNNMRQVSDQPPYWTDCRLGPASLELPSSRQLQSATLQNLTSSSIYSPTAHDIALLQSKQPISCLSESLRCDWSYLRLCARHENIRFSCSWLIPAQAPWSSHGRCVTQWCLWPLLKRLGIDRRRVDQGVLWDHTKVEGWHLGGCTPSVVFKRNW